jgi:hypothetical protein
VILAGTFCTPQVWLQRLHVLFFLEIGSRCVHLAGCTASPTGAWVVQQARRLGWRLQDGKIQARFLLRDRDSKFTAGFDEVFRARAWRSSDCPIGRLGRTPSPKDGWGQHGVSSSTTR